VRRIYEYVAPIPSFSTNDASCDARLNFFVAHRPVHRSGGDILIQHQAIILIQVLSFSLVQPWFFTCTTQPCHLYKPTSLPLYNPRFFARTTRPFYLCGSSFSQIYLSLISDMARVNVTEQCTELAKQRALESAQTCTRYFHGCAIRSRSCSTGSKSFGNEHGTDN